MSQNVPDLASIRSALLDAVRRDAGRRKQKGKTIRTTLLAFAAILLLCGSALAAGDALGVINLGAGLEARQVDSYPAYDVATHEFVQAHGDYIYHVTGGRVGNISACPTHGNDIYIEATQPLTATELKVAAQIAEGGEAVRSLPNDAWRMVPGLKSVSNGCGNAGVEAIVGGYEPASATAARIRQERQEHRKRCQGRGIPITAFCASIRRVQK